MIALTTAQAPEPVAADCWNRIGIRGDRSCPELKSVSHCQNCPVFSAAGRRFLNAPPPTDYRREWTDRLAAQPEAEDADLEGVLIFRLADEWLALPVQVLVEITPQKPIRRVPHRAGLLAGLVNIRGELYLCAHLRKVLGIAAPGPPESLSVGPQPDSKHAFSATRMLLTRRESERWVFAVDEVDQVHRIPRDAVGRPPATLARSTAHLCRGVFYREGRAVGLLDDGRLFDTLRVKLR